MQCCTWRRLNMIWFTKVTRQNIETLTTRIYRVCKEYTKTEEVTWNEIYLQLKKELDAEEKNSN
ncbi:MAG: hypothetical protein Tp132SUR1191571_20 [Prokaryotic dsDNA virus sp.]|nr:MAG: hypothetical protein Tp132SUR1191571_20 [Prokaryotic dsDNA virus sp.]